MKWMLQALLPQLSLTAQAGELRMLTNNHPPLHFQQGPHMTGFAVEVVQTLAQRSGDTVQLQPMLRALHDASQ